MYGASAPLSVHTDHATMGCILIPPQITICQMDIWTVLFNIDREAEHIPGVKNQVTVSLSCPPDSRQAGCYIMVLEVTAATEWIDDIKAGIIHDEWIGPIAHGLANPSACPPPPTASTKKCTLCNSSIWKRIAYCGHIETLKRNR